MSDRIPDVMKMLDETPCKATPREELRNQIMSSIIPKNEREWWSKRTIEQLERELNAANERIKQWHNALTPLMPSDFKCWHENTPNEWPEVAAWVITSQRERIKRLEEMYEGEIGDNEQFLGSNLQGLLTRELNWSKDRIRRLEEVGDKMAAWLLDPRNLGGGSSMASQWYKAKEAKP